jgi:hypothetical protein
MGIFSELTKMGFEHVVSKVNEKKDEQVSKDLTQKSAAHVKALSEARQEQLQRLRSSLPTSPPERMRATIQINEYRQPRLVRKKVSHAFGDDSFIHHHDGEETQFAVDMIVELPEADLAIIRQYELDDVVLEETAAYDEYDLAKHRIETEEEIDGTRDLLGKAIRKRLAEDRQAEMKNARRTMRVGNLLLRPFTRVFDSPHEANEFSDLLKKSYLPSLKALIDKNRDRKPTETLEF